MNVKIVETFTFDMVRMLMTLAVVATKSKELIRLRRPNSQDDREIERIAAALPENQTECVFCVAGQIKMPFAVPPLTALSDRPDGQPQFVPELSLRYRRHTPCPFSPITTGLG